MPAGKLLGSRFVWLASLILLSSGFMSAQEARGAAGFTVLENLNVVTAEKTEISRFTEGGIIAADGASGLVITLAGEMNGRSDREGVVAAVLVPEVAPFDSARRRRLLLAVGEVSAAVSSGHSGYFASRSHRIDSGFPRYRVLLYNTTGTPATVSVFVSQVR